MSFQYNTKGRRLSNYLIKQILCLHYRSRCKGLCQNNYYYVLQFVVSMGTNTSRATISCILSLFLCKNTTAKTWITADRHSHTGTSSVAVSWSSFAIV